MNPVLLRIQSDRLRVSVAPQHGFVIASVALAGTDENLLWNPPEPSFEALSLTDLGSPGDESIDRFDREVLAGGWFPMFPTAGLPGSAPDRWMHGEAPRIPWTVVEQSASHVTAAVETPVTRIRVLRRVVVTDDTVTVTTIAHNRSGQLQHVTFGEHPCFSRAVFAGGELDIKPSGARVGSLADPPNALLAEEHAFAWPNAFSPVHGVIDLSSIPSAPDGRHDHVALAGVSTASISGPRHSLDLAWDSENLPNALLWQHFNPAGSPWEGDVFALEPTSAEGRTFDEAVAADSVRALADDETLRFWMSLTVRDPH